jgi:hypothetical protein
MALPARAARHRDHAVAARRGIPNHLHDRLDRDALLPGRSADGLFPARRTPFFLAAPDGDLLHTSSNRHAEIGGDLRRAATA